MGNEKRFSDEHCPESIEAALALLPLIVRDGDLEVVHEAENFSLKLAQAIEPILAFRLFDATPGTAREHQIMGSVKKFFVPAHERADGDLDSQHLT